MYKGFGRTLFYIFWHFILLFAYIVCMEASFLELKSKQVINTVDGKCLGHITDIIFDVATACALGFVVPGQGGGFLGLFKSNKDLFIPFDCVCKIGVDVILVELYINDNSRPNDKGKNAYANSYIQASGQNNQNSGKPQNIVPPHKNN